MDDKKIAELGPLLSMFEKYNKTTSLKFNKKHKAFIVDVDSESEFVGMIDIMGGIGGFFNVKVTYPHRKPHYRISIIDYDFNLVDSLALSIYIDKFINILIKYTKQTL